MDAQIDLFKNVPQVQTHEVPDELKNAKIFHPREDKFPSGSPESIQTFKERLMKRAEHMNKQYVDVGSGGNCFFHCMAYLIYKNSTLHFQVRNVNTNGLVVHIFARKSLLI